MPDIRIRNATADDAPAILALNDAAVQYTSAMDALRLQELQALITAQQRAAQEAMVGREVGVLYEKAGRLPGQMVGKSDHLHAVHVTDPEARVGDLVRVRIKASAPNSLAGERL